jgi:chemotaxis protein MotB
MLLSGAVAALAILGGCHSQNEYQAALDANRKCQGALEQVQGELGSCRAEKAQLESQMDAYRTDAEAAEAKLQAAQDKNTELASQLDRYRDELTKLRQDKPELVIGGPVLPAEVNVALKKLAAEHSDLVEYLPRYGMVKFKSDLTFALGSDQPRGEAVRALGALAQIIQSPDAQRFHIYVAGHTDDVPVKKPESVRKYGNNWGLSAARAISVIKVLFNAGVDQKRMGAVAFSKYHPVEPNTVGNKGNPANRRVEIWIVPQDRLLTQ